MQPETAPAPTVAPLILVRPEPPGQFTAQAVGLPELSATAASRDEALRQVQARLGEWVADGRLVAVPVPAANPWLHLVGHIDPTDPGEQVYLQELTRLRREDLERTLLEHAAKEGPCPNSSSTPTT